MLAGTQRAAVPSHRSWLRSTRRPCSCCGSSRPSSWTTSSSSGSGGSSWPGTGVPPRAAWTCCSPGEGERWAGWQLWRECQLPLLSLRWREQQIPTVCDSSHFSSLLAPGGTWLLRPAPPPPRDSGVSEWAGLLLSCLVPSWGHPDSLLLLESGTLLCACAG